MNYEALVKKAQELEAVAVQASTSFGGHVNHEEAGEAWGTAAEAWSAVRESAPEHLQHWERQQLRNSWEHCTRQADIHFAHCP